MVSLKDVRISNSNFKANASGMVALFVGGTSGIGKGTLAQFTKLSNVPKVYIVGRSKSSTISLLNELQSLNPQGTFIFIETEISLIKNVDTVCKEIKENEKKLDLIFLSPGYLTLEGRNGKSLKPHRRENILLITPHYRNLRRD
jgi:NADP-dependent 3-hydroxy acid dehydrogenase YdfG